MKISKYFKTSFFKFSLSANNIFGLRPPCTGICISLDIKIGSISRSYFGRLFCYGFGSAIFIYIAVNMSMVLGLLPIVGSPLPIMSYGGSSMLATMIGLSIVMSTKIHSKQIIH